MTPGAVILCGGQSRRMGRPKAWLPFGPECLLQRVARLVAEAAGPVVVVAAPGQDLPALDPAVRLVRDEIAGRGPLQGICAGLAAFPAAVELVYVTGTDAPLLHPGWIARLVELIGADDLAIPDVGGHLQPLAALYRAAAVRPAIAALLAADRLRAASLADAVRARRISADELRAVDPDLATLRNLNTPEDYEAVLCAAGLAATPGPNPAPF